MNFLTLDVGSTCCKCQVFSQDGAILFYRTAECALSREDGGASVDIRALWSVIRDLVRAASETTEITSVAVASFGESFVLLDENDELIAYPMLYTDPRGEEQAEQVAKTLGKQKIFSVTGTVPHAMYSVYKLLWWKQNRPEIYRKADKLLLICDYIGYLLTGKRVIDYSLAARTGVFDIRDKCFSEELLSALGIDRNLFSVPMPTGSVVGDILPSVTKELGLPKGCRLILGSHDQICATLGAGVFQAGQAADGMGTVECITAVFEKAPDDLRFGEMGYCVVPFLRDLYCTYIFNYTSNSIVNWFRSDILHGYKGEEEKQFAYLEGHDRPPTEVLLLPYFAGAATPYQDADAKGAFLNLTKDTTDLDMHRAILEGTSYEMKVNLETAAQFGIRVQAITATGGGANSDLWLHIKSDILGLPVRTLRSSEGGLCGLAVLSAVAAGAYDSPEAARAVFVRYKKEYVPQTDYAQIYSQKYQKYKKLYHILKEIN